MSSKQHKGTRTASQVWNQLTPEQRESLFGWILGSYAPSTYAVRFPLRKTEIMTRATNVIAAEWKGAR